MSRFRKTGHALAVCLLVLTGLQESHSGGVLAVAGPSGFNPTAVGKPITWANGSLSYYTDLGALSPVLSQDGANAFLADAFSHWTSVPGTALTANRAGALAEDVDGSNFYLSGATLTMPADVQPSATHRPLGVVYDQDGSVTEALLGVGAGSATFCSTNSVFGGADAYTLDANFAHALLVINGNCVQQSSDLPNVKYRLVRAVGRILGVGWSQLNDNVRTGTPAPTSEDLAGFPVMHPRGPLCNGPIAECIPNPDQLRMDDRSAIAYLYPGASPVTARVRGRIYFTDERGQPGPPMQGVNVVARLLDPGSGQPSKIVAAATVSGALFRGSNGNPVTGYVSETGEPLAKFGGSDMALRGAYDLPGLEIPEGSATATYQITLEALNPLYKGDAGVGAARYGVVAPSGSVAPIVISNLGPGSEIVRDIVMPDSARVSQDGGEPNTFAAPAPVPMSGSWWARLGEYGDSDFYYFRARAGRTATLRVTALDENFTSTTLKLQPMLGIWSKEAAPNSPPALRSTSFNTTVTGQVRLNASTTVDGDLMIGIADARGDGRPDFLYHARLLYADSLMPTRMPVNGGIPVLLQGYGFNANTAVTIGGQNAPVLARSGSRLLVRAPAGSAGMANVLVTDLGSGDVASMTAAATYGVEPNDQIHILPGINPSIPVGAVARTPTRVRVTTSDGVTPVPNVSVTFSASPVQSVFVECGATPCSRTTDDRGEAEAKLMVNAVGENGVSASLSNGAHVEDTIVGTAATSSIFASVNSRRVPVGTTTSIAVSVRVSSSGNPVAGQAVNFSFGTNPSSGTATLAAPSVITSSAGDAGNTVNVSALGGSFTVLACLPANGPCATINILAVAPGNLQLQVLRGGEQILAGGDPPSAVIVRVTDLSDPNNPVRSVNISVSTSVIARPRSDCGLQNTDCRPANLRPLATSFVTLTTNDSGLATFTPSIQAAWGAADIHSLVSVGAGAGQTQTLRLQVYP